ncbi:50S ribosomal protein L23 [Candidatus Uhrbacteria bacterium CG10_big_fil_rev_8_21_14_0_10_50_16]|uniref:Large ribosomal subunit protein uL23 n=1 Tax=Candidatus Uhrbacteria bacterium CG10_big_fil_rev_8_21_14_0_10_50_16 TaxID=1975039 RepID=A0A2H0RLW6_9BACT|nr:MAG: 50S ribosomal protein L23 [Candidatus Uhrbacteria bacterium CG10_big_fil_rev_8_21_14_0_10_50_16]
MAILKRTKDVKVEEAKNEKEVVATAPVKKAAKAPKATADKKTKKTQESGDAYRVLVRPLVTEKSARLASEGVYTFQVAKGVDKIYVRQAVKALYNVDPVRVNILNQRGKEVRVGRVTGSRNHWRKAYVFMGKGQHLDVYEGV